VERDYRQRLANIDAVVARARLDPALVVERAAGLLAGRVGCRVDEAHTYLLRRAAEQRRPVEDVASEVSATLESRTAGPQGWDAALDEFGRPYPHPQPVLPVRRRRWRRSAETATAVGADWAAMMQQVLDGLGGHHLAILPMRDGSGEVVDFRIVAGSPETVDFSGRPAAQMVGLTMNESYPAVPEQIRQAWREALADGQPREVGPLPYAGASGRSPANVAISARIQPVGPGLLASWVRHDEETRLAERIAATERLGNLGWGEVDLVTGETTWSQELYRIYERDPALGPLVGEEQDALLLPEDEPMRRQAAEAFGRGQTMDLTYRIRIGGGIKHLRTVLDAVRDGQGRPIKLYGITQDLTAQETSRVRLAEVEALLREHQQNLAAEHELAAQLQQIVLPVPAEPFDLPNLRVAVRYLPAEQASRVGGDWFHAEAADDGCVVLAVGDVAGHGIQAATAMAQLRHLLAGLTVTTTTEPDQLLWHLNRLLHRTNTTASAVVARYHPSTRQIQWAQAGHPAPLRTRAGTTTALARPKGMLLGAVRTARYDTAALTLDSGDLLLFYTDGLIEGRHGPSDAGVAEVMAVLNDISTSGSAQPLAHLLTRLRRANPDDDTCILAVRHHDPADAVERSPAGQAHD
jgi:serine phosphatase RsbU (regulator of sigma subunit)